MPSRAAGRLRPSREVRTPSPVVGLSGLSTTASTGIAEPGFGSGRSHAASVRCSATTSGVSAAGPHIDRLPRLNACRAAAGGRAQAVVADYSRLGRIVGRRRTPPPPPDH